MYADREGTDRTAVLPAPSLIAYSSKGPIDRINSQHGEVLSMGLLEVVFTHGCCFVASILSPAKHEISLTRFR